MGGSWPRARQIRDHDLVENKTRTQTFHVCEQSVSAFSPRSRQSANRQRPRTQIVRRQSAAVNYPRPRTSHGRTLSANVDRQRTALTTASQCPSCRRSISRFASKPFQLMTSFDPTTVRQAVAGFTPLRPQKFQDLIPAKDVIIELRQRRASYCAIPPGAPTFPSCGRLPPPVRILWAAR